LAKVRQPQRLVSVNKLNLVQFVPVLARNTPLAHVSVATMLRFVPLSLIAGALLGSSAVAQTAPRPSTSTAENPIIAPQPVPRTPTPERPRAISGAVAAQLAAAAPKYTPPPPKPEPKVEEEEPDMRDVDKPRNGIIRLPKYVVREPKPAVLNERAVNTAQGLKEIAMRRYFTDAGLALNRFQIPLFASLSTEGNSNEARAMEMYREDERLQNMADMKDAARTSAVTDPAQGAYIRREVQKTYMRTNDFGWTDRTNTERK
jgi:hypothetical protein